MNDGGRFDETAGPQGCANPTLALLLASYSDRLEPPCSLLLGFLVNAARGAIEELAARGDLEPELRSLLVIAEDIDRLLQIYRAPAERPR